MSVGVRRALLVVLSLLACGALIVVARRAANAPATSDTAVIESYTLLASQGRLLLGAYSRFQWHHPGPLYFFLLAPFYSLAGGKTSALHAGAVAISLASMLVVFAVAIRRRPTFALASSAMLALLAWRASEAIASPWNPHVTLIPTLALIVVAADVVAGRALMLPMVAFLASLSGQAHIALMPTVLAVGVVALSRALVGLRDADNRSEWRRSIIATAVVLTIVWALPIYEQLTGTPRGNFTELWLFFGQGQQSRVGQPLSVAVSAWADMFVGVLRPDFYVAHGWPFVESPVKWAEWLSLGELAGLAGIAVVAARRRDTFIVSLGVLLLLASGVSLWSATHVDGQMFDHDVFWLAGLGVLSLAMLLDAVLAYATRARDLPRSLAWTASVLLLGIASVAGVRQLNEVVRRSNDPPADAKIAHALADDLFEYMNKEHVMRPLVKIDQDAWPYVAGAILDLQKRGRLVSVEEDWVVMFTPQFRVTGREDATITVAMPPEHVRLTERGARLISSHEPVFAHAEGSAHRNVCLSRSGERSQRAADRTDHEVVVVAERLRAKHEHREHGDRGGNGKARGRVPRREQADHRGDDRGNDGPDKRASSHAVPICPNQEAQ